MTTILCKNAHEAVRKVYRPVKGDAKRVPVLNCVLISHTEGMMAFTMTDRIEPLTETIPARTDESSNWAACVPVKPFRDWLAVTRSPGKETPNQITLTFDPACNILKITAGPARASFKCIDAQEFPPQHWGRGQNHPAR